MKQPPLSGRYELEEIIGVGGMSVVYRAWDLKQDREVAVKVLKPEYVTDEDFVRRFNHEAQAAAQMSHPNIVSMYDVGQDGETRYIVMEYVHGYEYGVTLKEMIRQQKTIEPRRAVQLTLQILSAVNHAHKNRIVHRDIKPHNILMDRDGRAKVADFGIARMVTSSSSHSKVGGGSIMGSVHYFSPEQANGLIANEKSDLYSVGVVLFEMVTGQVPFTADVPVAVALKHINEPPPNPSELNPEVSAGLSEVILKALEKDPARRYQTAADFARDLKLALKMPGGGFVALGSREKKPASGRWARIVVSLAVLALLGAGLFFSWRVYQKLATRLRLPAVTLVDVEDAKAQLEAVGLIARVEERYDGEIVSGMVISQSPADGSLCYPGDEVILTVSLGREAVEVPRVSGLGLARSDAVKLLEDASLMAGEVYLEISDQKVGTVVRQEPAAGEMAQPFSEVTLYVSGECAEVPPLSGLTVELARSTLAASGFLLDENVQERLSEEESGLVIAQSIPAGEVALLGETVSITISQPVPEMYYAQTEVTVTVEEDGDEILCMLSTLSGDTREVYRGSSDAGNQTIALRLDSYEEGEQLLTVYVNDEMVVEKTVVFEKREE